MLTNNDVCVEELSQFVSVGSLAVGHLQEESETTLDSFLPWGRLHFLCFKGLYSQTADLPLIRPYTGVGVCTHTVTSAKWGLFVPRCVRLSVCTQDCTKPVKLISMKLGCRL